MLIEAAMAGNIQMIETLLEAGFHFDPFEIKLPRTIEALLSAVKGLREAETDRWLLLCVAYWRQDKMLFGYLQSKHTELQHLTSNESFAAVFLVLAVHHQDEELVVDLLLKSVSPNRMFGVHANAMVAAVGVNSTRMLRLLLEHGGDTSDTYGHYYYLATPSPSLLTMAIISNAMECVSMLLPLETRQAFRRQALEQAIKQESMEVIELLLGEDDDTLAPSTQEELELRVSSTKSPQLLDLMLTWWCPSAFPISVLDRTFFMQCRDNEDPALLSVYLAHGVDLTDFAQEGDENATSPLVQGVIRAENLLPAVPVVQLLLESGVPSISVNGAGQTPGQDLDEEIEEWHWQTDVLRGTRRKLFRRCRDLFAAHGSPANLEWLHSLGVQFGCGLSCWLDTRDLDEIRYCLAAGANATERGADGITPLTYAYHALTTDKKHYVTCVHPEIVRVVTKSLGRKPTQLEIYGVATDKKTRRFRFHVKKRAEEIAGKFIEATCRGDLETVRRMVESDEISVDAVDKTTGETALVAALASDKRHVCDYLMRKGAHALGECTVNGRKGSVLLAAVLTGDVALVRQVAASGGLPSAATVPCVLVEAAKLGDFRMIETLLDLGAHVAPAGLTLPWPIERADLFNISNKSLIEYLQRTHTELEDLTSNESIGRSSFSQCTKETRSSWSSCCASQLPLSAWNRIFERRCSANINPATGDPALVSVFLAHGVDLTDFAAEGDGNATSTLIRDVIRTHNSLPAIPVVEFLLESGVPSISVDTRGRTPEQEMDACLLIRRTYDRYRGFKRRLYRQCRDLFAAHSSQ